MQGIHWCHFHIDATKNNEIPFLYNRWHIAEELRAAIYTGEGYNVARLEKPAASIKGSRRSPKLFELRITFE